jgi:diguanylate cyclase (GGDEF)-like protein/PAS domain S-box-containing protein
MARCAPGYGGNVTDDPGALPALREQLEFIEELTSRVPVVLFQFRVRADGSSHFPYMSQALAELFGVLPQDVMQDAAKAFERVHPDDFGQFQASIQQSVADLSAWHHEFRVNVPDGRVLWLSGEGTPQRLEDGSSLWHGSMTDITRRRLEQAELEATRKQVALKAEDLRVALDTMSQGILTLDANDRITLINKQFLELLELPAALIDTVTHGSDLMKFQRERGDFGDNFNWVETSARPFMASGFATMAPERYLRKTRAGRTLEVKSLALPSGGTVRTFSDVTHFVEAQAALRQSENRFRSLTALSSDWYWEQDENFKFVRVDGNAFESTDATTSAYMGLTRWERGAQGLSDAQWAEHRHMLESHQTFHNFEMQRPDGRGGVIWTSISGMPIFDADGEFRGYRGVGRNITEQKRVEDESQRLAFYDALTGLPNRRLLMDRLTQAMVASARSQGQCALLFIDLDNFKDLNDTLGHDVGDQLLEKVANRLVTCIRQGDTVSRFGGDEFVVMLEGLHVSQSQASDQVKTVGEKILATLNLPFDLSGNAHYSTPSIGITLFSGHQQSVDELLKRADLAMYQSKAAGRNTLRFFDPDMQAQVAQRAALEVDLRQGLERAELVLYYQSVVNNHGHVVGVEALVRWHHPQRGPIAPADFIPVAEQTGLILPLGQWVMRTACEQLVTWSRDRQTRDLTISVNISAREFHQVDFVQRILTVLGSTGADPNKLRLEITEGLLLADVQDAIQKMVKLRARGVRFALDDFGTGYSSLAYLKQLPLDELKIDRTFVRDVLTDANGASIARTIIALAHSLGLTVVAEGVETDAQRDFLLRNGCESFQGYAFGRPVPIQDVRFDSFLSGFEPTAANTLGAPLQ